ncbi:MAG: phosphoribosyltransferase family protein [Candidatus Gottesmanbacteria bacterium]
MRFKNRVEAGKKLAITLREYRRENVVVYGLPRGGVVLAYEIAKYLRSPLELIIIRKIGHPYSPEYAVGVVAQDGCTLYNEKEITLIDKVWLENERDIKRKEAQRRRALYNVCGTPVSAEGKIAILVDDGIATGLTVTVGILELNHQKPKKMIVAVPVCPKSFADEIKAEGYDCVALDTPFLHADAVNAYYEEFPQVSDEEVIRLIRQNHSTTYL